jgi:hypothetical protein
MNHQERARYLDRQWVGIGWTPIIKALDKQLGEIAPNYEIKQVKEKFGGLRYYYYIPTSKWAFHRLTWWNIGKIIRKRHAKKVENCDDLVVFSEKIAEQTCEKCGSHQNVALRGKPPYWVRNLCNGCAENHD